MLRLIAAAALVLGAASSAWAQPERLPRAAIAPVEVLECKFAPGKGPADVDGLARAFNQWMERTSAPEYAAYVLQPISHSKDVDFDAAWVGEWPDGTTMGKSMAHYFANGAELAPLFDGVLHCATNTNYSAVMLRAPVAPGRFGPLEISTCTLRLGAALDDALQAVNDWLAYSASYGSTTANWLLFPAYGERSGSRYSFKWAVGYESYEAFGREYDQITNGDGLDKYNELFEPLLRCDSPRLYSVRTVRPPRE